MHHLSLIIVFLINAAPKEQRHNDTSGREDSFHASGKILSEQSGIFGRMLGLGTFRSLHSKPADLQLRENPEKSEFERF